MNQLARGLCATLFLVFGLCAGTSRVTSQQPIGISMSGVLSSTISNGLCSFDCSLATHTSHVAALPGANLGVILYGDIGMPGVLMIGLGPVFGPCPGIVLPGINNGLEIFPGNILVALSTAPLSGLSRTSCSATGSISALSGLNVPSGFAGVVLTFQGLVFDQFVPAFTRSFEVTLR